MEVGHEGGHGKKDAATLQREMEEERRHFTDIVTAYAWYERLVLAYIAKMDANFRKIPEHYKKQVTRWPERIVRLRKACIANQAFIDMMLEDEQIFENRDLSEKDERNSLSADGPHPSVENMEKVKSTLKQFVRDWSAEGREERERCYGPILDALRARIPLEGRAPNSAKVLLPGAGLGRLVWEVARAGYAAQGCEVSFFMLIASNFILNRVTEPESLEIFPFIHNNSNVVTLNDQLRKVTLPDVNPRDLPQGADFSMCAGEFVEIYSDQIAAWDSVITCFFVDTAKNIIEYVEAIARLLKPGGVWINFGPLLYHWTDMPDSISLEISYQELRDIIVAHGFRIEQEQVKHTTYTGNSRSMMQTLFACAFFVAVRTDAPPPAAPPSQTAAPKT